MFNTFTANDVLCLHLSRNTKLYLGSIQPALKIELVLAVPTTFFMVVGFKAIIVDCNQTKFPWTVFQAKNLWWRYKTSLTLGIEYSYCSADNGIKRHGFQVQNHHYEKNSTALLFALSSLEIRNKILFQYPVFNGRCSKQKVHKMFCILVFYFCCFIHKSKIVLYYFINQKFL